jgi:peptide/nickel transport system substrate-binding protein
MRLHKPIIATSAVAFMVLAACGGSNNSGGPPGAGSTTIEEGGSKGQAQDPNRQGPAPEIEGAQKGGTIKVVSVFGLNTMDPTEAYYGNTLNILEELVTRSLTQYAYDPKTKDEVLVPDLATDLGTHNDNFTQWTFTLRDGVKWENGDPVTPEEVKYGIERSFDRATFPEGAIYSNQFFLDGDKYKGPYKSGTDYKGVVIKGQKITIKMAKPFPDMPYWGAFPAMGPIPTDKSVSDPAKYAQHPWSTGPYMFKDYTPEKSLTLVKNPNWDPATDPARHQYVDGFDMQFDVPSAKIDQIMIQDNGEGKNTMTYDDVLSSDYLKFKQTSSDRLVTGPYPLTNFWYPDYRKIKDKRIREAIAWAYPYHDSFAASGVIEGVTRIPATNIEPPGVPGRVPYNPVPGHKIASTDTDKAHALLKQANALGYELKFLYATDDPLLVAQKDAIVTSLEKAGFKATPVATTVADLSTVRADPDADINVRSGGWISDWPSGSSWIPPVFQSVNVKEGIGANYAIFSEKKVDQRIQQIYLLPLDKQAAAWNALDQFIMTKYFPVIPISYGGVAQMRGSNVQGMQINPAAGTPTFKDMWLKQ